MGTGLWLIRLEKCVKNTSLFWQAIRYHWSFLRMTLASAAYLPAHCESWTWARRRHSPCANPGKRITGRSPMQKRPAKDLFIVYWSASVRTSHVFGLSVEQHFRLLGFFRGLVVQACVHALNIKIPRPFGNYQCGNAIADQVGQCPCF